MALGVDEFAGQRTCHDDAGHAGEPALDGHAEVHAAALGHALVDGEHIKGLAVQQGAHIAPAGTGRNVQTQAAQLLFQHTQHLLVVVYGQNAQVAVLAPLQLLALPLLFQDRQIDEEGRALAQCAFGADLAAVGVDDLFGQRQPQAGALPCFFGGEEGFKDALQGLLVHAGAGVRDADADIAGPDLRDALIREAEQQLTARHHVGFQRQGALLRADGVDGIDADVQQHLLQLGAVAQHFFPLQLHLLHELHLPGAVGLHQLPGLGQQPFHRDSVVDGLDVLPAHGGDLLHHVPRLFGGLADLQCVVVDLTFRVGIGHDEISIAGDGGQEIVELVRDAAGQGAHQLEPLAVL